MPVIKPFKISSQIEGVDLNIKTINKIALIDADRYKHVVTYRVYQAIADEGKEHCKSLVNEIIDDYLSKDIFNCFKADSYIFCFSAPSRQVFRNSICQEKGYKANRSVRHDPNHYAEKYDDMAYVFEYIKKRYQTLFYDDLEADDILSMLQTENSFIFSHDKDLKQVVGWHWNFETYNLTYIEEEESLKLIAYQLLKGDATDNIPGLKGFGDKAWTDFINEFDSENITYDFILNRVLKIFIDKLGIINGFDTFNEMWNLIVLKRKRGLYLEERYKQAFFVFRNLEKQYAEHNTTSINEAKS